jgi:hypothetical protein
VELNFLKDLTDRTGPFATVYLDASHDTEDAAHQQELRWAAARSELAEQGADGATLEVLERVVGEAAPPVGAAGRVLVAQSGDVLLDRLLPEPPDRPGARWSQLPDLLPMLVALPEPLPVVVVRIDQAGGEILLGSAGRPPEPAEDVRGREHPLHKVPAGGWSHLNMQERVEESWRRNTAEVAARVDAHVSATAARLVVLAGDPRARSRLRDALSERAAGLAVDLEYSGTGPGGGAEDDDLRAAVAEAARDAVTAERQALLDRLDQAAGRPDGLAVDGLDHVLAALRAEQVDTLLLDGGTERDTEVWIGEAPSQLATDAEALRALGAEPVARAPVDAALIRAAAASGAAFQPLGGGRTGLVGRPVADGVAALLRYPLVN